MLVRLRANVDAFRSDLAQAARSVAAVGDQADKTSAQATTALGRLEQSAKKNRAEWDTAGTALTGFGAVTVAALAGTVKAAIDWESAWTGVNKTVDGSASQMAELEGELRGLAKTLPSTHGEIAAVAEAAGQLGVKREDVAAFTETMVALGQSTNLSAEEASTSLAQMMNVMKTAPEDVGRLGASLVALGNAGASTEADILSMASYLTGAGALIGASESDILAMANTMTSLGVNAERGGGVMTRVMQDIYSAVQNGGSQLEGFASAAGMSAAEFARAFEADPIRAIGAFTDGLARSKESGENVVAVLNDLGIKGTQDTAVLLQLAGAQGLMNENLDLGAQAWAENTALTDEAGKRYDTTASKLAIARNGIVDAAISIGETFLPVVAEMASAVADAVGWFAELPEPVQIAVGGLAGVAGAATLAGGAFLLLFPRVVETVSAFKTLNATHPGVASGLTNVGKAAGAAMAISAVAWAAESLTKSFEPAAPTMERATEALLGMGDSLESVDALFQQPAADLFTAQVDGLADAARRISDPSMVNRIDDFGGSLLNAVTFGGAGSAEGAGDRDRFITQLDQLGTSLAFMVESGNADLAAEKFEALSAEWERGGGSVSDLKDLMPAYGEALLGAKNQQDLAAESAKGMAGATEAASASIAAIPASVGSTYESLTTYAAALGLDEDATEELRKKTEELGQTLADFINPLGVYTSLLDEKKAAEQSAAEKAAETAGAGVDAWQDFVVETGFSFDEYMKRLEEQVSAQTNWRTNMLILAGQVSGGTLAELARMGPEGAPLVADLVNRSDAELDRFDEITAMRSKEATDAWGAQLTLATPVLAEIGKKAGSGVVAELAAQLAAGTTTVAQIAQQYGVNLANGINPILTGLGKKAINGYTVRPMADGGVLEDHVAQIAPAGAWRVWAEEETGGEAYIPLSPAKRARSVDIWRETGRRLGQDIAAIEAYANGGFSGRLKDDREITFTGGGTNRDLNRVAASWNGIADFNARVGSGENPVKVRRMTNRGGGNVLGAWSPDEENVYIFDNADWAGQGRAIGGGVALAQNAVLRHEMGHAMGLSHSSTAGVTMNPTLNRGYLAPQGQDRARLRSMYPTRPGHGPDIGGSYLTTTLPPIPSFPYNAIAGSATEWAEAARAVAQDFLDTAMPPVGTSGVAGGGALGGGWQSIFNAVKAVIPQARVNSAYRPGDPGAHGRGKAVDFGFGTGPGGAGSAGLASINRLLHDKFGANLYELIYDGIGDDRPDLKNGKPLSYSAATQAQHRNHVHAAVYAKGGILNPHVRDTGGPLLPGFTYNGTGGPEETVLTKQFTDASSRQAPVVVMPSLDGLAVEGRIVVDSGGLMHFVDGRLAQRDAARGRDWRSARA